MPGRFCVHPASVVAVACAMAASLGTVARAANKQPPTTGDRRIVRVFTFDEPHPDPVPPGWERSTLTPDGHARPGFPPFNRAELDYKVAASGTTSVRLPTAGGCAALRLRGGEAPVFADAEYAVSARIRTDGLVYARAFITARLLDQHLKVIPGSEVRSDPVLSPGNWTAASVRVPGGHPTAAWLQIDLELLQPRQFLPPPSDDPAAQALEQHRLYREDVRGGAWFDDVTVTQIPRAEITTTSPCNIIMLGETPTLRVAVRDLGGDRLKARVDIFDMRGRRVEERLLDISPDGRPVTFAPRLPGHGWYSARLEVLAAPAGATAPDVTDDDGMFTPVSSSRVNFVYLSVSASEETAAAAELSERLRTPGTIVDDRARFGFIAERATDAQFTDLPAISSRLGTRFMHLPIWGPDTTLAGVGESLRVRRPTVEALLRSGQTLTFSIRGVPSELSRATSVPIDDPLGLSGVEAARWLAYLAPTLDIYGQRVTRYQLGGAGGDHAFWRKDLAMDAETIEAALATLVPGPMIALPWPADRGLPRLARPSGGSAVSAMHRQTGPLIDAMTVWYPAAFPSAALPETLARLNTTSERGPCEHTVVLELPEAARFGHEAAIIELMRRAVEFWRTLSEPSNASSRLALDQPWTWGPTDSSDRPGAVWPKPELASFAVLMDRLSGRRIVGELSNVAGVKCYILAARNTALGTLERGALIAWNESAEPGRALVDAAATGAFVTVIDAMGNQTRVNVAPSETGSGAGPTPLVTLPVGPSPVFIEGIDPYLALFAASFRLEPTFMPAVVREHEHRITLSNPWPVRVTGKLQLKEDTERTTRLQRSATDEWRVSPSGIVDFDIAPGQTTSVPVTLWFGAGQLAGIKDFVIIARAMADRAYPPIRLHAAIEVGLDDIEMNPELQLTSGTDVVVIATVTNKGSTPRTLRLETAARGMPGQQLQISDLPPGQTVLRRFVFPDALSNLSGRRVVVSLSDQEEAQRLNKAVQVP